MEAPRESRTSEKETDIRTKPTQESLQDKNELNEYVRKPIRERTKAMFDKFR